MKKWIVATYIMLLGIALLLVSAVVNGRRIISFLYNKTYVDFQIDMSKDGFDLENIIANINLFSQRTGVSVSQYEYVTNDCINVYSTEPTGDISEKSNIRTKRFLTCDLSHVGITRKLFPFSIMTICYHSFDETNNVGLYSRLYLDTMDSAIVNDFTNCLKGCVVIDSSSDLVPNPISNSMYLIIHFLLVIGVFLFIVFCDSRIEIKVFLRIVARIALTGFVLFFLIEYNICIHDRAMEEMFSTSSDITEKADSLYRINISILDSEPLNWKKEEEMDRRIEEFYHLICEEKDAFLISANGFYPLSNKENTRRYLYQENTDIDYLRNGKRITVNENYLHHNYIYDANGNSVINAIIYDDNVVNVLVPEYYMKYEKEILKEYTEDFYFQKISVENMYNEAIGKETVNMSKEDIKVNLVYVKNKQKYFTYNEALGDKAHYIEDPIVVVYTGNVHCSFIASMMTNGLYFRNIDSNTNAYESIVPLLKKSNLSVVRHVTSVYDMFQIRGRLLKSRNIAKFLNLLEYVILSFSMVIVLVQCKLRARVISTQI